MVRLATDSDMQAGLSLGQRLEKGVTAASRAVSALQVSRLTWFTRHDAVIQKAQGPPASALPPVLSQCGTAEAGGSSIQVDIVPKDTPKTHSGEWRLLGYRGASRSIMCLRGNPLSLQPGEGRLGFGCPLTPRVWLFPPVHLPEVGASGAITAHSCGVHAETRLVSTPRSLEQLHSLSYWFQTGGHRRISV